MTLRAWVMSLGRFLSGRAGLDRQTESPEMLPLELPEIDPPHNVRAPDRREKEHLEYQRDEHDRELARLRAIARARSAQLDT